MSFTLLNGSILGVDKVVFTSGDGLSPPVISSANSEDANRVRVTFDQDMFFGLGSSILLSKNWEVFETATPANTLTIIRVIPVSATEVDLIVISQSAIQYTVRCNSAKNSAGTEVAGPTSTTFLGQIIPQTTGSSIQSFYGLESGMQGAESSSLPPIVVITPNSPNNDVVNISMDWKTEDPDSPSDILNITIEGIVAVVNNIIQPGFNGSVVANGQGGQTVQLFADVDHWPGLNRIDWTLVANDGINTVNANGFIDKVVTLPAPAPLEVLEVQFNQSFSFPLRFTSKGDIVKSRDETAIEENMRTSVMIQKLGIPLRSRIGSFVPTIPFDPKDIATREQLIEESRDAIAVGETRVVVDENVRFVEDPETNGISMVMPYRLRNTARDWRHFRLSDPDVKIAG